MAQTTTAPATFLDPSPWIAPPTDLQPALAQDLRADVAIIGAGYTGLSAALALKRAGVAAVLLERDFAGCGASGRNAGHLTPTIGKDLPTLLMLFGKQRAAQLVRFADASVRCVEQLIREQRIDCDYQPTGNIMAAVHPKQERRLRQAAAVAQELGAHVRFIDRDEMRTRGVPPAFVSGALEEAGGTLHPGKYVSVLRRQVLEAGIALYEQTRVSAVSGGAQPSVRTARGSVRADRVLLATNAYTPELGQMRHKVCPVYVTLFETEPLNAAQLAALDWRGREGIYTAHETLESYRLTAHNTIVGGSKHVRYTYGSALAGGPDATTQAVLARAFRDRFPQLPDLPIAHFWGGWIGMTLHFLPLLGGSDNIYYAVGYNGHGVAGATMMGAMAADLILGRSHEHAEALMRWAPPLPPEPLRWLLVHGIMVALDAIDARTDRQVRAGGLA